MAKSFGMNNNVDLEEGVKRGSLYPGMQEDPRLRWAFIRKVYSILCLQFMLVVGVAFAMMLTPYVRYFLRTPNGRYVMIALIIVTFILCILMHYFSQKHPWNYLLLFLFTLSMAFMVGAVCTQSIGQAVIVAASLTLVIVVGLTMFTFVAAKMGYDFHFLGPFLFCAVLLLVAFGLMRIIFPMGEMVQQVIGCLSALVFSGFIIYDTDNVIKRFTYDQYIDAAACLFSDMINLFLSLLSILDGGRC